MSRYDINCSPFHHKRYTPGTKIWYRKASFYSQNYWSCIILASACSHFRAFTCAERTYFLPKMCMVLSPGWDVPSCVACLCLCPLFKLTGWFKSFQSGSVATQRVRCCFQIKTLVYNLHPFLAETSTSGCWKDSNRIPIVFLHLAAIIARVPWSVSGLWRHSCEVKPNEFVYIDLARGRPPGHAPCVP